MEKKSSKSRDVVLIVDSRSVGIDLEMSPSGRNEGPTMVEVDKSSKFPLCDDDEKSEEQLGGKGVVDQKAMK